MRKLLFGADKLFTLNVNRHDDYENNQCDLMRLIKEYIFYSEIRC